MRRLLIFLLMMGAPLLALQAQDLPDSLQEEAALADSLDREAARYAPLDSLLSQFYATLERESTEAKNAEFDVLIGSCRDSLTRQHVTLAVFDHYRYSRLMGEEAVAMHIFDEWISSGKVQPRSEFELFEAERFALENRRTLIGMKAPEITLRTPCGAKKILPESGKPAVLFFYSPHCAKCRMETYALPAVLADVEFPLNFYAVNVDTDRRDFRSFRKALKTKNKHVKMIHLWDP
ncbi:MAG: thioredoxin family protein, partial [Bacteroidales bacterium]|nr:thioredoxin family protein [Bacteroidales bacterium]